MAPPAEAGTDAGTDADSDGSPSTVPPECPPGHAWMTLPSTPWETSVTRFGGISSDERTMAWTVAGDDAAAPNIEIAMRTGRSAAFGAPVTLPAAVIAVDRVALDPTGTSLIAVAADRTTFVAFALSNSSSSSTWSVFTSQEFANLMGAASDTGSAFYEPVLGQDAALYYVLGSAGGLFLYESTWNTMQHVWQPGTVLSTTVDGGDLSSPDVQHLRRPTGASADGRTLFFFDGVAGHERSAWRDSPELPFSRIDDIADLAEAAPDEHCDRLYFQQGPSAAASIFTAQ
jgi:hypothetical protein